MLDKTKLVILVSLTNLVKMGTIWINFKLVRLTSLGFQCISTVKRLYTVNTTWNLSESNLSQNILGTESKYYGDIEIKPVFNQAILKS